MKKIILTVFLALILCVPSFAEYGGKVETQTLAKSSLSWDGQKLPDYAQGKPEITILRIMIPPGEVLPVHKHPVINAGFLISGELTVIKKTGETLHLKAGDSIIELVDTWHYGKNEGDVPADIVVFYMGTQGEPITIKE